MKRFAHFILAITLLTVSTNVFAQTNIQRKFFDKLELGKHVSKKMIASSIGVPEYDIREEKKLSGTEYTVDFNGYFGGQEWAKILILVVNDRLAMVTFWNSDDNMTVHDDMLGKLTLKYGKPEQLGQYLVWTDNLKYNGKGILLHYTRPSVKDKLSKYFTALTYIDFKLFEKGQLKALGEL